VKCFFLFLDKGKDDKKDKKDKDKDKGSELAVINLFCYLFV
jgi:hypothetical protein